MRKGRDGGKKKNGKKKKRGMKIVATMSLPAVDRPNADRWNAARSRHSKHFATSVGVAVSAVQAVQVNGALFFFTNLVATCDSYICF